MAKFMVINRLVTGNTEYGKFSTLNSARKAIAESGCAESKFIASIGKDGKLSYVEG